MNYKKKGELGREGGGVKGEQQARFIIIAEVRQYSEKLLPRNVYISAKIFLFSNTYQIIDECNSLY